MAVAGSAVERTRSWKRPLAVFASTGDDPRVRRPADVVALIFGWLLALGVGLEDRRPTGLLAGVTALLQSLPSWVQTALGAVFALTGVYCVVLIVVVVVAGDRKPLVRDLLVAAVLTVLAGAAAGWLVEGTWPPLTSMVGDRSPRFPVVRVAVVTALALTAAPALVRPVRRVGQAMVVASAAAAVALSLGDGAAALGGFGVGMAVAGFVHLVFGSTGGVPPLARVADTLSDFGMQVFDLERVEERKRGVLMLDATDRQGTPLRIKVYGRDAGETQLASKIWRTIWYRGDVTFTWSRQQQVEHEATQVVLAARAGMTVPEVVGAGSDDRGDAVLVVTRPGEPLGDSVTEASLEVLWGEVRGLQERRISHGSLDLDHLVVRDGRIALVDWDLARFGAPEDRLLVDLASLLVTTALLTDPERAVACARRAVGDERVAATIPYIQRAALSAGLRRAVKESDLDLDVLREQAAGASGGKSPELVRLQRVTLGGVAALALTIFAAWLLISQLADIGLDTLQAALESAIWGWVAFAFVFGQLPRLAQAASTLGASSHPLPLGPTWALQMSMSFVNLAVPSTAGRTALSVRYFQRQGVPVGAALSFGALDGLAGFIVQVFLLIVTVGFGFSSLDVQFSDDDARSSALRLVGLVVVLLVLAVIVALLIRKVRQWIASLLRDFREALRGLGSGRRLRLLLGGNLAAEVLFAMTIGLCALSQGYSISLANLVAINVLVAMFAGLMPVPGGIGVSEAALTVGLTAAGMPEGAAFAAALTYRMITFYLPPIWGWFALRWLKQRDFL